MFDINKIPFDDKKTWDLIKSGNTYGVFQLESHLGKHWCKEIQPNNIDELGVIGAILRPGCLNSKSGDPPKSTTQRYADRKHGKEPVESYHPALDDILGKTYNLIVYQEQAMAIAQKIAGFDLNDADQLRKAIGKKDPQLMSKLETEFVDGCKKQNIVTEEQAKEIFGWIKASQRYSFNASHAVSYAINGYKTAYCKAHYPLEFYCAYLRGCKWKQKPQEAIKTLVIDGRSNDIEFIPPTLADLQVYPYIKKKKYIAFGLGSIRDIGDSARQKLIDYIHQTENILNKSVEKFNWTDLLITLGHKINKYPKLGSKVIEALMFSGALDYMRQTRHKMQFEYELYQQISMGVQKFILTRHLVSPFNSLEYALGQSYPIKKNGGGAHSQKISDKVYGFYLGLKNPAISLNDDAKFLALSEEKYLGISLTCSQSDDTIQSHVSNYTCQAISNGIGSKNITFVAEITRINNVKTKNGDNPGQNMAFLDLYDKTGGLDGCVMFPDIYKKFNSILNTNDAYYIMASRGKKNSIIIENMEKIT